MTKSLTEQWKDDAVVYLKDDPVQMEAHKLATIKLDYSKMYFVFNFKDGKQAKFRMDKDCHTMQQFLDRMNEVHKLEQQLAIATKALKEYSNCKPTEWMTCVVADKALKEIEEVKWQK